MFDIAKYLEKFKVISRSRIDLITTIKEEIKNICDINLEENKIKFKDGVVWISEKPIIKTAIFLKKQEVLDEINRKSKTKVHNLL